MITEVNPQDFHLHLGKKTASGGGSGPLVAEHGDSGSQSQEQLAGFPS